MEFNPWEIWNTYKHFNTNKLINDKYFEIAKNETNPDVNDEDVLNPVKDLDFGMGNLYYG